MKEPLAELTAYSRPWYQVPDADLVRLTAAARAAGHRWYAIAACDNGPGQDIPAVIRQQYWISPGIGPGPLFSATQRAVRSLTGSDADCCPALPCPALPCPALEVTLTGRHRARCRTCCAAALHVSRCGLTCAGRERNTRCRRGIPASATA